MTNATHNATASVAAGLAAPRETLLDTAHRSGHFKRLVAAIKSTGLADMLDGPGPFTLFAPNDSAFDRLARNELADLLKPESRVRLTAILKLHVVPGHVPASAADERPLALPTLQGEDLSLDAVQGRVRVNKARVVERDIQASNGVMHAIDAVLMPASL